jgi:hypothetical protein
MVVLIAGLSLLGCESSNDMATPASTPATPAPMPVEAAPPAAEQAPMTTTDASLLSEPNWAVLFSGHDLTAFNTIGGGNWQIMDGAVQADSGEPGFLVTKGAYTDFLIRAEFQASPETNSGIFIRCQDPNAVDAEQCYEINIYDQNQNPNNLTGAIVNLAPPAASIMAGNEWNTFEIIAEGPHLTVRLNDTVTVDIEDEEHAAGYIALQFNTGLIRFRDVRLRPL